MRVRDLAQRHLELEARIIKGETLLAQLRVELKQIDEVDLPAVMQEVGLTDFGLIGGARVEVRKFITASIPKGGEAVAYEWLELHNHGGLIKRRIQILFGREDVAWAKQFLAQCARRKRPLQLEEKMWVEPQTLMAFVREQLRNAAAVGGNPEEYAPTALLGVFERITAKIIPPKKAKT
jgi:hypothetical protein